MQNIQTCLWFNEQAEEAARFYASCFKRSKIERIVKYGEAASKAAGQPKGSVLTVEFELEGTRFLGLNGGPHFKINPAISFFVGCESVEEIDALWQKLRKTARMELGKYPWSDKYGWCEDRFGVNWQLMLGKRDTKIAPALLFANERYGRAKEAIDFYTSTLPDSSIGMIARDEKTGAVLHSTFRLGGQGFVIMEGPLEHEFGFSPAVSFVALCESQQEIDTLWSKLSADPEAEQCGWLRDKFGVSWQVIHHDWGKMLSDPDPAKAERMMKAVLSMKKIDLKAIRRAYEGA